MLAYLCHRDLLSPPSTYKVFLIEASVRSSIAIVCACLVVAWCRVIPRYSATSLNFWDNSTDPSSGMMVVCKKRMFRHDVNYDFSNRFRILTGIKVCKHLSGKDIYGYHYVLIATKRR